MATEVTTAQHTGGRLNELYWNSGRTIDDIVAELGVSRNTLYSSLEPLLTGHTCTGCDGVLVFTNRTNRTAGMATCERCGSETDLSEDAPGARADSGGTRSSASPRQIGSLGSEGMEIDPRRAAMIGGAATIGALVGYAAIRSLRS
jgi:hypothetical protein